MQKAWVIEDGQSSIDASMYATCKAGLNSRWTYLHEEAIRFSRKKDAEEYAALHLPVINEKLGGKPYRILEHLWVAI